MSNQAYGARLLLWGLAPLMLMFVSPTFGAASPLTIELDGTTGGKVFDGIGAGSGGGASSRLLINYPEPQRSEILDYLFKPNYGASLQQLKVEIGSDGNAGMGAEASHRRHPGEESYHRGYEWWVMKEAKRRNPAIKLLALAWNFPAWVANPNSQATADYLVSFVAGAKREQGLDIDYIGIWNETPMDAAFITMLRRSLDAAHLPTRIIADDLVNDWSIVDKMAANPELRAAVDVIATHYPRTLSPEAVRKQAQEWGKPLWSSEDGPWGDAWGAVGTQSTPLAELLNRNYIKARITSTNIWNLATAYYDILDYTNAGLLRAKTPWSGHYELTAPLWVVAHTTQFAQPGWRYIDSASAMLPGGGSFVTLHEGAQYSLIAETLSAQQEQPLELVVSGGLSQGAVHVWRSTTDHFLQQESTILPVNGRFRVVLAPGSVYSLTTTTGQHKGAAQPPPERPFPVPYEETFERDAIGTDAVRYFSEQNGAFEVRPCSSGRRGHCLNQVVDTPPIWWTYGADAPRLGTPTVIGDMRWRDYRVSADVLVSGTGYAGVMGRVARALCCDGTLSGYQFRVYGTGKWELVAETRDALLASGDIALNTPGWRHLELVLHGDRISGSIDGHQVFNVLDQRQPTGLAGLVAGWNQASFDNFTIVPVAAGVPVISTPPLQRSTKPPPQPVLYVPSPARNAVKLSWAAAPGAIRYRIRMLGRESDVPRILEVGNATSYTVTTLTNGQNYRFQVIAVNENGESPPSSEQTAKPTEQE